MTDMLSIIKFLPVIRKSGPGSTGREGGDNLQTAAGRWQTPTAGDAKGKTYTYDNNDNDFDSYKLYRSYIQGVDTSQERVLIADITNQTLTDFTDTGLEPDSTYYYAVYVFDEIGLSVISNEVVGTTMENDPPTPVELAEPWAPDSSSLELSWSVNSDDDFLAYELFCWDQDPPNPPDLGTKRVIARLTDRTETFFTHENLVESFVYWYEVSVVDSFGATTPSNTVSGSPRPATP